MSQPKFKISCEHAGQKATVKISGRISQWNNHAEGFRNAVESAIASGAVNVDVHLNTPGGDVFEANEIGNEIQRFTGTKTAILGAMCASAGTYIACVCDKVIAKKNTQYMIHKPWGGFTGNADEVEAQLVLLKNLQNLYAKTYSEKTGLPVEKIEAMWTQDCWMNAEQAKTKKFIDEVEGATAEVTSEDIAAIHACGYKNPPAIAATTENSTIQTTIMKDKLVLMLAACAGFSLTSASSDAEFLAFIDTLKGKASKADQLQADLDRLTREANEARNNAVLDKAEANKQILASERAYYAKQLLNDFEGTKAHIEAKPKLKPISGEVPASGTGKPGAEDRSTWSYADWQDKDPQGLVKMSEEKPEEFEALFNKHYGV